MSAPVVPHLIDPALSALFLAHQISGRVRLKLAAGDLSSLKEVIDAKRLIAAIEAVPGVKQTQANLLARSLTIHYAPSLIPDSAWQDLADNQPSPAALALWAEIARRYRQSSDT
jgi:hypothetical protein